MARVICPFCLKTHDFDSSLACPEKPYSVPKSYVRDYDKVRPLWLLTVGFPRHGKSTYLAALTLMLEHMDVVWPNVFYRALDNDTTKGIQKIRRDAMSGNLAEQTLHPDDQNALPPRPLLLNVHNLPDAGSRCLVMYDMAGQVFTNQEKVKDYVAALKQVTTTWFLVALEDLKDETNDKTIVDLFNAYLSGMEDFQINPKGRNLIVVYTKADEVQFPPPIKNYISSDPLQGLTLHDEEAPEDPQFSLQSYVAQMETISQQLRDYTRRKVKGGGAFINMVEEKEMKLVFCATSALGQSPDQTAGKLQEDARRYRVLDPFLWAVALDRPTPGRSLALLLDASPESLPAYDAALVAAMAEILNNHGEMTTYYLGRQTPASIPGQPPPTAPPAMARARLLGPILQEAAPGARLLVVTTGPILDLEDFYDSAWRNRLVILALGDDIGIAWPHHLIYRPGADVRLFTDRLLRLYEENV